MSIVPECPEPGKCASDGQVDLREGLFNDGPVGSVSVIQLPLERITCLRGLMLDWDPKRYVPDNLLFPPSDDPRQFFANIEPVLNMHPLLRHAEIRSSGTGLHPILWFSPPVELKSWADQQRWAMLTHAVQRSLFSDPNAPGITALTRPIGSINSKNGATVELLRPGAPIDPAHVVPFVTELADAPFRVVATVLLGADVVEPCPLCRAPGSRLSVLDRVGMCYHCDKVTLERLFDAILAVSPVEADDADTEPDEPDSEPTIVSSPKSKRRRKINTPKPRPSTVAARK